VRHHPPPSNFRFINPLVRRVVENVSFVMGNFRKP
jgi:hypothetical protein